MSPIKKNNMYKMSHEKYDKLVSNSITQNYRKAEDIISYAIANCLPLVKTYHPTIVPINKAVMKEWKRYSNMPVAKHLFSSTTLCACTQPPNLR